MKPHCQHFFQNISNLVSGVCCQLNFQKTNLSEAKKWSFLLLYICKFKWIRFFTLYSYIQVYNPIIFRWNSNNFSFKFQYTDVSTNSFYFELCIWTGKYTCCCWSTLHSGRQCTTSVTRLSPVFLIISKRSSTHIAIVFLKSKKPWPGYFYFFSCLFYK